MPTVITVHSAQPHQAMRPEKSPAGSAGLFEPSDVYVVAVADSVQNMERYLLLLGLLGK